VRVLRAPGLVSLGSENDEHLVPFHSRPRFDFADVRQVSLQSLENARAELAVRHLASAKPDGRFHFVAILKPLAGMLHAVIVVVIVGGRPKLHFLDRDRDLLLLGLVRFFLRLVLELAKVDDPANRRIGVWRNFHEVQTFLASGADGVAHVHHAQLLSVVADDPDCGNSNSFVNTDRRHTPVVRTLTATAKACSYFYTS